MPQETRVDGVRIVFQVIGDNGPWVALVTGGRRGHEEFLPLAAKIAAYGYRVLLHDRRNTGGSDIVIEGQLSEEEIWADDLHCLLQQQAALPAFVGGASSGARTAMMLALRHPKAVRALLLMRVTGGAFAAQRLPENYYSQFIRAAEQGGMQAVCDTPQYRERIETHPAVRASMLAQDPARFIAVLSHWRDLLIEAGRLPVMGVTEAQLNSIAVPTIVIPGNDKVHASGSARAAQCAIPGALLHTLPIQDQDTPLIPFEQWAPLEPEIAQTLAHFMASIDKA